MRNASGIGPDGKGRIVCVSTPYGIIRWGISPWLSDMPKRILGPFAELRRANQLRHVWPFVRPSIRMAQLGSQWRDFHENWYLSVFRQPVVTIQVSMKLAKTTLPLREVPCAFCDIISLKSPENLKSFRLWEKYGRLRLKCDGTRAETRFLLSAKRTSPFKSAGASVQSSTGSRGVRISGNNAG